MIQVMLKNTIIIYNQEKQKSVKQSEIITYQPNTFDIVDKKSVTTEHPKTSHKLSKTLNKN